MSPLYNGIPYHTHVFATCILIGISYRWMHCHHENPSDAVNVKRRVVDCNPQLVKVLERTQEAIFKIHSFTKTFCGRIMLWTCHGRCGQSVDTMVSEY
jgi:hypothetical protein